MVVGEAEVVCILVASSASVTASRNQFVSSVCIDQGLPKLFLLVLRNYGFMEMIGQRSTEHTLNSMRGNTCIDSLIVAQVLSERLL